MLPVRWMSRWRYGVPGGGTEMSTFWASKMKSRYASRIVARMFLGQLGYVKDVFDNFKASKGIFWRVCASWRPHWVDQYQSLTGSVVINLDWRYENVDFGASKMKSRYDSKNVTRMFLGQPGYDKHVFDNFEASKRNFWGVCALWRPIIQGKIMPLQGLWPTILFDGLKMSILGPQKWSEDMILGL